MFDHRKSKRCQTLGVDAAIIILVAYLAQQDPARRFPREKEHQTQNCFIRNFSFLTVLSTIHVLVSCFQKNV